MGRGAAVYDLTAAHEQFGEPEVSPDLGDSTIADIPHFRGLDADSALVEPDPSGVREGRSDGQTYRDDITGAVLGPGL
eukprot:12857112-Alexandrium_andersonii.AAC.1